MAGKSTIAITFRLDSDAKKFKDLIHSSEDLKKVLSSAVVEADSLKKSLINWSQGVQAINAITSTLGSVSSALSDMSGKLKGLQQDNILTTQLTGKTGDEMLKLRNSVQAVAEHFGTGFNETLQAANTLAKSFGISIEDAMQLVRDGLVSGANANGDFIDTLKEYPRYFKEAGLSAEEFVAISTNATKQGVFSDKGVDAIKEANIRIREMTTATATALENIGISSEEVQQKLQQGSITTFEVIQQVAAKLKELPASSSAVGAALADIFGGPGEDAGLEYIKTLDGIKLSMEEIKAATQGTAEQQERQIKMQESIKNGLSSIIDLSKIYTDVQPYVDLTAQIGMAAIGMGSMVKTVKSMNTGFTAFIRSVKAAKTATAAFKVALSGLLISTGVGLAIWALSEALAYLIGQAGEAANKIDDLKEAEELFKSTAANAKVEIDKEIKSLGELIESKQGTTEAVQRLNSTYGNAFGTYKTASEWYDVLTKKSSIYAKQVGYEAQARRLATSIAEKEIALEKNAQKQKELQESGNAQDTYKYLTHDLQGRIMIGTGRVDTKEMKAAKNEAKELNSELDDLQKEMGFVQGKLDEYAASLRQTQGEITGQTEAVKVNEMTWQQVSDAISQTEKSLKNTTDAKQIANLKAYNEQLKARKETLEATLGLSAKKTGTQASDDTKEPVLPSSLDSVKDYNDAIAYWRNIQETANKEEYARIQEIITGLEAQKDAFTGVKEESVEASDEYIPKAVEELNTIKQLSDAIAYYKAVQEEQNTSEAVNTQKTINALEAKRNAMLGLLNVPTMQEETGEIESLTGKDLEIRLQLIGLDEVKKKIAELNSLMATASDEQKGDISDLIDTWKGYENILSRSVSSAPTVQESLGAISSAMYNVGGAVGDSAQQWLQWGANTLNAISSAIPAIMSLVTAKNAEATANTAAAASGAASSVASIPFVGAILAVAAVASVIAAIMSAPKFAEGGIAYGPTLGLFGEYPGASNNPEVVAPLDRLRSLIEPSEGFNGDVRFVIDGDKLVGILNRRNRQSKRS